MKEKEIVDFTKMEIDEELKMRNKNEIKKIV